MISLSTPPDSTFVRHEPCPFCGSKDNLARYDDGHAYCFGCKYTEPATVKWFGRKPELKPLAPIRPFPEDTKSQIGAVGWTWLAKYGIMAKETKSFLWSDEKQWLIFPFYQSAYHCDVLAWQARNFNKERPKPKYWNQGPLSEILQFYGTGETVVLTEDVISAIKVGRSPGFVGMPIFGSNISLKTIVKLSTLFKQAVIWLDMDKSPEAVRTRSRASQYIPNVYTVLSDKDPKEYSDIGISNYLLGAINK